MNPNNKMEYKREPWGGEKNSQEMHPYAGILKTVPQVPCFPGF